MSWSTENLGADTREAISRECFQVREQRGSELHGLCPSHDDHNQSFSYNFEKDCCNCLACDFKGDLITLWGQANNITDNAEAFSAFKERFGTAAPVSGRRGLTPGKKGGAGAAKKSTPDETTKVIPEKEWEALALLPANWRKICRDKFGWSDSIIDRFNLRFKSYGPTGRIAIPIRRDDRALVNVRLYQPGTAENKVISWGAGFGKSKLFPAPATWHPTEPILLCEGEKDCLTALSQGFNAVTHTTGAKNWDHSRFNRFFAKRTIYVAYDADEPGRDGAAKVAQSLATKADKVYLVKWPAFMADGQDVCDWFTVHGKTAEQFHNLLLDAEPVTPEDSRSRNDRAEEIPEELRRFFVGKQFKPRICADEVMTARKIAYDPRSGQIFQWNGKFWEEIHETVIRHLILSMLGQEGKSQMVSDVCRIVTDLSIIRGGRAFNDRNNTLPLRNGMFDLVAGQIVNHDPDHLNTYCLDIDLRIDPDNLPDCPHFKKFLIEFVPDDATRREVLKFAAYCLTRETRHEKALFLIGPGGDGKSTFIRVLESILGEVNVSNISLGALEDQFQRVMLKDKLLNVSTEIEGGLLQSGIFKAVVSGDRITASYKHRDGFSFTPVAKHVFAANKFPPIQDTSRGLLRRMMVVETARKFKEADLQLKDKLLGELDAIFLMLIRHLQILQEEGFKDEEIPFMVKCRANFAESNNPVIGFAQIHLETNPTDHAETLAVYHCYVKYCAARGYKPKSEQHFGKELKSVVPAIERKRASTGKRQYQYHGVSLLVDGEGEWK